MFIEQSFSRRRIENVIDNCVERESKTLREAQANAAAMESAPDTTSNRAKLREIERRIDHATNNLNVMQRFAQRAGIQCSLTGCVEMRNTPVPVLYASDDDDFDPFSFENDWFYS